MDTIKKDHLQQCPIEAVMSVLGGKWKVVVIDQLLSNSVMRFSELRRAMPGVTQKMLTQQLRELEQSGIVERKIYPVVPPKVEYRLTTKGKTLEDLLVLMKQWGVDFINSDRAVEPLAMIQSKNA
ncbi:MAG TPA: helix-turn-helix domain-containing protein [Candidatus Saccharimonadia bacterium]|nr:helix-turn-helix domain-containing protein [Candidatus Saccharimonadia bacterium]